MGDEIHQRCSVCPNALSYIDIGKEGSVVSSSLLEKPIPHAVLYPFFFCSVIPRLDYMQMLFSALISQLYEYISDARIPVKESTGYRLEFVQLLKSQGTNLLQVNLNSLEMQHALIVRPKKNVPLRFH